MRDDEVTRISWHFHIMGIWGIAGLVLCCWCVVDIAWCLLQHHGYTVFSPKLHFSENFILGWDLDTPSWCFCQLSNHYSINHFHTNMRASSHHMNQEVHHLNHEVAASLSGLGTASVVASKHTRGVSWTARSLPDEFWVSHCLSKPRRLVQVCMSSYFFWGKNNSQHAHGATFNCRVGLCVDFHLFDNERAEVIGYVILLLGNLRARVDLLAKVDFCFWVHFDHSLHVIRFVWHRRKTKHTQLESSLSLNSTDTLDLVHVYIVISNICTICVLHIDTYNMLYILQYMVFFHPPNPNAAIWKRGQKAPECLRSLINKDNCISKGLVPLVSLGKEF